MKKAVIITDLRLFTLFSALQIYKKTKAEYLLISEATIQYYEFGSKSSIYYKKIKVSVIKMFYDLLILKLETQKKIENDKGVISSLISETNNAKANSTIYPEKYANFYNQAIGAESISNFIEKNKIEKVFLFNGRLASSFGIAEYCKKNYINTWFYEWGEKPFNFVIQPYPIHDLKNKSQCVIKAYLNKEILPNLNYIYFSENEAIFNKLNNYYSRNYSMEIKLKKKYDITIFLGSPHELFTIDDLEITSDINFCENIRKSNPENSIIAIRAHPNQLKDPSSNEISNEMEEYAKTINAIYFPPESKINSHELIKNSSKIITAYSSICLDAYYLGVPVEIHSNSHFKYYIDFCEKLNIELKQKQFILAQLIHLQSLINQDHLHPKWIILLKLFNFLENLCVKQVHYNN
jgi:hypothetical protein